MFAGCATQRSDPQALTTPEVLRAAFAEAAHPVARVQDIPASVMSNVSRICGERHVRIANPNEPYNATDVINRHLPDRQLRFAAKSNGYFFLCYDVGGGWSRSGNRIIVLATGPLGAQPILVASCQDECHTIEDLRRLYDQGKLVQYRPTFEDF